MPWIAYDRHGQAASDEIARRAVDFRHERTRGVYDLHAMRSSILANRRRDAMRGENDGLAVGHVLYAVDELVAEALQFVHDDLVVDEFMQAVHVPEAKRLRDCRVDACAQSMRFYDLDLHRNKLYQNTVIRAKRL